MYTIAEISAVYMYIPAQIKTKTFISTDNIAYYSSSRSQSTILTKVARLKIICFHMFNSRGSYNRTILKPSCSLSPHVHHRLNGR